MGTLKVGSTIKMKYGRGSTGGVATVLEELGSGGQESAGRIYGKFRVHS